MATQTNTTNWPDLAIGLYDQLTGRNAEISYKFDDFELQVPSSTSSDAQHAQLKMTGVLKISTRSTSDN